MTAEPCRSDRADSAGPTTSTTSTVRFLRALFLSAGWLAWSPGVAPGQSAAEVARERAEFEAWLRDAPTSPYRALAQLPIGRGITLGPTSADIPLAGVARTRLEPRGGGYVLDGAGGTRPAPRGRLVSLGNHRLLVTGPPGQAAVMVYGPTATGFKRPAFYADAAEWRFSAALKAPATARAVPVLGPDGAQVEATEAGMVEFQVGGHGYLLRVLRVPAPDGEESELEIYFRDATNDHGTYPAGRFVSLIPAPGAGGRYLLDFNRARNPFCAYSTLFPCPAPWRGNRLPMPVPGGERYTGGGLAKPPV